jgi:hypothetical protein
MYLRDEQHWEKQFTNFLEELYQSQVRGNHQVRSGGTTPPPNK